MKNNNKKEKNSLRKITKAGVLMENRIKYNGYVVNAPAPFCNDFIIQKQFYSGIVKSQCTR